MTDTEKEELERNRQRASLKNMYFNRYLLVRYLTAGFFFTNLYWFLFLLLAQTKLAFIPLILLVFLVLVVAEQVKLYSSHTNDTPVTKWYYRFQLAVNLVMLPMVFLPIFSELFPFMANTKEAIQLLSIVLLAGSFLCLIILRRLHAIVHDQDRHYERIKQYEKTLHI
ncbi:hypothetical protein J9303_03165 [Bacillaceae bacterium Marseille-Q3522]|nr:hypothetical protein [Bacillaceae bacterium Marseille-Q3522]